MADPRAPDREPNLALFGEARLDHPNFFILTGRLLIMNEIEKLKRFLNPTRAELVRFLTEDIERTGCVHLDGMLLKFIRKVPPMRKK
jgi:hypothetical protein